MVAPKSKIHFLKNLDLATILEPAGPAKSISGTKVIATLGPASRDVDTLVKLLEAGMSCARVDLTWGSVDYHKQSLRNLQTAVRRSRRLCAVILDVFGRELTIRRDYTVDETGWPKPSEVLEIKQGQKVTVTTDPDAKDTSSVLPIGYPHFPQMCSKGDTLFVGRYLVNGADQSSLYLDVEEVNGRNVVCRAQNDAVLDGLLTVIHSEHEPEHEQAGMSNMQTDLPLLTQHDVEAIQNFVAEFEIDFIALTYTCDAGDVVQLRDYLDSIGQEGIKIIAKVENKQALNNFEGIAIEADAILFSRGNLGLDVLPQKMAIVQKAAIQRCNVLGKPAIITRLVDTMAAAPRCTRAEATDVANAVLDGVDGMLLGAETLRGKYPVETVSTVLSICRQAEQIFNHKYHFDFLMAEAMEAQEEGVWGGSEDGDITPMASRSQSDFDPESISPTTSNANGVMSHAITRPEASKPPRPQSGTRFSPVTSPGITNPPKSVGFSSHKSSSFGSIPRVHSSAALSRHSGHGLASSISQVESMASTAVRAAEKIAAKLIVVYASTGRTASLVAKYRPQAPILTLVAPNLRSTALSWQMQGRSLARQLLVMRGIIPMLAAPSIEGSNSSEGMLAEAVGIALQCGLVQARDHIVCLLSMRNQQVLKIVSVDNVGSGMRRGVSQGSATNLERLGSDRDSPALPPAPPTTVGAPETRLKDKRPVGPVG